MNPTLSAIFESKTVEDASGQRLPLHFQISLEEGLFLQEMVRRERPKRSLEIGCAYGVSSLFICEALSEIDGTSHTIIDPNQSTDYAGIGRLNIQRAGFDPIVRLFEERSYRQLPLLEIAGEQFDLAFIDGMHTFDYALVDFFGVDKVLRTGGVVVFDDVWMPAVRSVCRYVLRNLKYEILGPPAKPQSALRSLRARLSGSIDHALRFPPTNYVALRKLADDLIGDGSYGTRSWEEHHAF